MIHTIQRGDRLTMVGPDGQVSSQFTLSDAPYLTPKWAWIYRSDDAPLVVDRIYALECTFLLHARPGA